MHAKMKLTLCFSILAALCASYAPGHKGTVTKTVHVPAFNHNVTSQDHGSYIIHRSKTMQRQSIEYGSTHLRGMDFMNNPQSHTGHRRPKCNTITNLIKSSIQSILGLSIVSHEPYVALHSNMATTSNVADTSKLHYQPGNITDPNSYHTVYGDPYHRGLGGLDDPRIIHRVAHRAHKVMATMQPDAQATKYISMSYAPVSRGGLPIISRRCHYTIIGPGDTEKFK